ncbi:hypothetical protein LBPG_00721 [Lacticaseibacillus paracasei subsp. paracasei 8700:2]|uniref:Uncharacterized protein n=1 Tax=Lacticaseibacillus paracasei subsp. paracasei 8700:2 TaxID=537973 RepID=A0A826HIX6_LACPA|nr:hypothetical protein LBPG_00721 [Lacticaseibacillus paracasei subsp. paracasei 8700:2]GEL31501.1 hypothetical protein LPA04_19620 [Lacticaseibacillus paracasei subsp. paracasei]
MTKTQSLSAEATYAFVSKRLAQKKPPLTCFASGGFLAIIEKVLMGVSAGGGYSVMPVVLQVVVPSSHQHGRFQ